MEACRKIREKGFDTVPIIAMTAHAMKGDREKCIQSGMNDYISKPIKREVVFEVIEKWVFGKGKHDGLSKYQASASSPAEKPSRLPNSLNTGEMSGPSSRVKSELFQRS